MDLILRLLQHHRNMVVSLILNSLSKDLSVIVVHAHTALENLERTAGTFFLKVRGLIFFKSNVQYVHMCKIKPPWLHISPNWRHIGMNQILVAEASHIASISNDIKIHYFIIKWKQVNIEILNKT